MFPVEYVYADWNFWQTNRIASHADQESLASQGDRVKDTVSRVEGQPVGDGYGSYEEDDTSVFKYPDDCPEPAMEWLVRPRPSSWPSPELVQEIFESGCHLAPVGRGKLLEDPVDAFRYMRNPAEASPENCSVHRTGTNNGNKWVMDETEWRVSFPSAENKLGEMVSPVQRHILVLLKMIKKFYFPEVISTYYLKNLLFWECEKKDEAFWREDNSGS